MHVTGAKRGKTRANKALLIGSEIGVIFANQSQAAVKQTKANANYFRHAIENRSITELTMDSAQLKL